MIENIARVLVGLFYIVVVTFYSLAMMYGIVLFFIGGHY
jgi:hypothetical protein